MPRVGAGVYTDLNLVGLRSLEPLLENHQLMLASNAPDLEKEPSIPHAWMASARRHPFWIFVLAQIIKATGGDMYGCVPARRNLWLAMLRYVLLC